MDEHSSLNDHAEKLFLFSETARLKFKKLKTYFLKEHKRIQRAPSGSAGKTSPKWEFYEFLLYLSDTAEVTSLDRSWDLPSNSKVLYGEVFCSDHW